MKLELQEIEYMNKSCSCGAIFTTDIVYCRVLFLIDLEVFVCPRCYDGILRYLDILENTKKIEPGVTK